MTTTPFAIAAVQSIAAPCDVDENVRRHVALASFASQHGAKVAVFPELSLTGYEPTAAAELALDADAPALAPLQQSADTLDMTIIAGCPIRSREGKPYIGAFICRPCDAITVYRKRFLHPPESQYFQQSDDIVLCTSHGYSIGVAICADISNPKHPLDLRKNNASIYAAGVAMTPEGIRKAETNLQSYAQRHGMLCVMANYGARTGQFEMAGSSGVWSNRGELLAQAGPSGESIVLARMTPQGWRGTAVAYPSQPLRDV